MNISPATPEHAAGIAGVHVHSWQAAYANILDPEFLDRLSIEDRARRWELILTKAESQTLVARRGEAVVGFINYGRCRDEGVSEQQGEIWALYLEPESWGQGLGRALLAQALQDLRALGLTDVSLWVLSQNERGIQFYTSFGFSLMEGSAKTFELGGRQVEEICLRAASAGPERAPVDRHLALRR